jgi:hypothetical protein
VNSWLPIQIAVAENNAAPDTLALHLDTIGRAQIGDHETGSGVGDDGMVTADVGVVDRFRRPAA